MSANVTTTITPEQTKRSLALAVANAHAADVARWINDAYFADQATPLRQKDRHALRQRALEKLRQLQARIEEATA